VSQYKHQGFSQDLEKGVNFSDAPFLNGQKKFFFVGKKYQIQVELEANGCVKLGPSNIKLLRP
jgi:hypothetical protein